MAIRFAEEDARVMGRNARGVRGIRLEMDDKLVSMTVAKAEGADAANLTFFTVCQNGYGKRTAVSDYRRQGRGGKGLIDIQTEDRNGPVVDANAVVDEDELMIITSAGKVIRIKSGDVSVIGRNTKGVRLINLDEGEVVAAVAKIMEKDDENGNGNGNGNHKDADSTKDTDSKDTVSKDTDSKDPEAK